MKHLLSVIVFLLSFYGYSLAQKMTEAETRKQWAKMDSLELLKLPDSVRFRYKKEFPDQTSLTWKVYGLYDRDQFSGYKYPYVPPDTYYWKDTAAPKSDPDWIEFICYVHNDTSISYMFHEEGRLQYYRMKNSDSIKLYRIMKWVNKKDTTFGMPPSVKKKIAATLYRQAGEKIESVCILKFGEPVIYESVYSGTTIKTWTSCKLVQATEFYMVYGSISNQDSKHGCGVLFTMDGTYVPNIIRDYYYNKTIKMK